MKKIALLLTIFCTFIIGTYAQQIKASPFEGRWVWDGKGAEKPEIYELIFFGNIMLAAPENVPLYAGVNFSYTDRAIIIDEDEEWQYRLSGSVLYLTPEHERYTYTKAKMDKSPLEGIWADDDSPHEYVVFTGDIMVSGSIYGGYEGFKIDFKGKIFHPSLSLLAYDIGEDISEDERKKYEEELLEESIEFRVSGNRLTLSFDGEDIELRKIY